MAQDEFPNVNVAEAEEAIVLLLRESANSAREYGYDVYLPKIVRVYAHRRGLRLEPYSQTVETRLSPAFLDAAFELCRKGLLRPGIRHIHAQATPDGSAGVGFCITPYGRQWLQEVGTFDYIPSDPGRFAELLKPVVATFGAGFQVRALEAARCYQAHAYLAACTMCGAAAESILLAAATEKRGAEEVLAEYRSAQGRRRIQRNLVGQANKSVQDEFDKLTAVLHYWRDEASHGEDSAISESEAHYALSQLYRFACFVQDHWYELTQPKS